MLVELAVANLGVISDLRITFDGGMTALTGETGAGKTMIVEALSLLCGGRADPARVRSGADESVVEGLIATDDDEFVVRRIVPRSGRSRCYVDGELVTAAALADRMAGQVEICGQHGSVRLASVAAQRAALDRYAGIDLTRLHRFTAERREVEHALAELGGDERTRARELDLLRYQIDEIERAALSDPDEDRLLDAEEDELAGAAGHRQAAATASELLSGDEGVVAELAAAVAVLANQRPLVEISDRLLGLFEELNDCGSELRRVADALEDDPQRLEAIRGRRHLLHDLRRKYGDSLGDVITFHAELADRLSELESHDARVAELSAQRASALTSERAEAKLVGAASRRCRAAGGRHRRPVRRTRHGSSRRADRGRRNRRGPRYRRGLRYRRDRLDGGGSRGVPAQHRERIAGGVTGSDRFRGELSRVLLALYLVLNAGAATVVFDEVDAGVGGTTASAVGRALAGLSEGRQVLVVTHLPQVAALADAQMVVAKSDDGITTHSTLVALDRGERVIELSRMMSGTPDSERARHHADELLSASTSHRSG